MIIKKKIILFGDTTSPIGLKFFNYFSKQKYFEIVLIIFSKKSSKKKIKKIINLFNYKIKFFNENMPHRNKSIIKIIKNNKIELGICTAFPNRIRKSFINLFKKGIINFHPAALPYNKGSHHSFWGIYNNTNHGCTMHLMNKNFDDGQIIDQIKFKNSVELKAGDVFKKSHALMIPLIKKNIKKIYINNYKLVKNTTKGTYHSKKDIKKVVTLDSKKKIKVSNLWNIIRATKQGNHGYYIKLGNKKFKILSKIQKVS